MARIVFATIVSNLAAPLVFVLVTMIWEVLRGSADLSVSEWLELFPLVPYILPLLWLGMAIFVFPISLLAAIIGRAGGWRSLWIYLVIGSATGLALHQWVLPAVVAVEQNVEITSVYAAIGALCGWIYWRIAIRAQAEHPRTNTEDY